MTNNKVVIEFNTNSNIDETRQTLEEKILPSINDVLHVIKTSGMIS